MSPLLKVLILQMQSAAEFIARLTQSGETRVTQSGETRAVQSSN